MPRFAVGIIIGRNGEMIKKIQNDAGVRIQFKQGLEKISGFLKNFCNRAVSELKQLHLLWQTK